MPRKRAIELTALTRGFGEALVAAVTPYGVGAVQQSVIGSRNGYRRPNGSNLIGLITGRRVGAWRIR